MLKKIGMAFGVLILVLVVVGLFLPSSTHVSRSVVINQDAAKVFTYLNSFQKFNLWSPWAKLDPETKYTYEGAQTGVGAKMSWSSENPNVGNGSQEVMTSEPHKKITVKLVFEGQGEADAYYLLSNQGETTKVTWGFESEHGYNVINRYVGLMLDKWIGADYERGLNDLKALAEKG